MKYRNIELIREIISKAVGVDISYAYDDLVFPDHASFILQFDDKNDKNIFYHFHRDCDEEEQKQIFERLSASCGENNYLLVSKNSFFLEQKGEEIEIHFS